jgi:hypothetical protein
MNRSRSSSGRGPTDSTVPSTAADEPGDEPSKATPRKKKYEAPSFRFERVFEVTALTCGKVGVTQRSCHNNRKVS